MKASSQIRRKPTSQRNSVTKKEEAIDPKVKKQNDGLLKSRTITRTTPTSNSDTNLRKGPTKAAEPAKSVNSTVLSSTKAPAKPDIKGKKEVSVKSAITTGPPKLTKKAPAPPRVRTQTRTLKPEEVTVLKHVARESPKIPSDQHKAPVSFEVEIKNSKKNDVTSVITPIDDKSNQQDDETDNEDQYESEFESYESDFECGSSTSSKRSDSDSTSDPSESDQSSTLYNVNECEEETEEDRPTIEQKLDSGHYDIKVKKDQTNIESVPCSATSKSDDNQPDSVDSGQYEGHCIVRFLQNRYTDILNKITLNTMPFELYEEKPASYEHFLLNYATSSGVLNYTQTESEGVTTETQTNEVFHRSCWSQYPPQFSKNTLTSTDYNSSYIEEKHGFGIDHCLNGSFKTTENDVFQRLISKLHNEAEVTTRCIQNRPVTNPNHLRKFLQRSCTIMEMAMNKKRKKSSTQSEINSVNLKQNNLLQNSVVSSVRCDLSSRHAFLTLHECQVLHQSERHEYSICIWDTRRCTEPQVVLSCRENVTCIEKSGRIVIAGTASGALCLWDIEKTDEGNGAIQIITPMIRKSDWKHHGEVVAIKILRRVNNLKSMMVDQILTLFETGVLITWMLSTRDQYPVADIDKQNINLIFHNAEYCVNQKYYLDLTTFLKNKINSAKDTQHILKSNTFPGEMMVNRNNVIVAMNSQLIIVNHLEQKCSAVIKIFDPTMTFLKHPKMEEFMIAHSLNNTVKILKVAHYEYDAWQRKKIMNKHPQLGPNTEKSPTLSNKSCAIQNIVKYERDLYLGRIHGESQTQTGTTLLDSNLHNTGSEPNKTGSLHHGQIVFLKHVPPRYHSLFFLDHARIICVDRENAVRLIDMETNGEIKLNERIASELTSSVRLLGMIQKQVMMAVNDQEILFYDLKDHLELGKVLTF